jgi:hypothetical protein
MLSDADEKNRFDVEKYIKTPSNHAKIDKDETFTVYATNLREIWR